MKRTLSPPTPLKDHTLLIAPFAVPKREQLPHVGLGEESLLSGVLEDAVGEQQLVNLSLVDHLLDGAAGDEAVDCHFSLLPQSPRSLSRLPGSECKRIK